MKFVSRVCENCGERVLEDAPKGLCPACVLETGLGPLANDAVAGIGNADYSADVLKDFGDYELLEEIGRGGQGVVYRARQKSLNRTVALKVIGLGQWATQAHLKRFRREAESAANLDHPCIVPIYEVGEREGSCYFSMKFIDGGQLDEVAKRTPISIRNAAELIAKLARTVHYAHEHGVLHRDIKPGNILLDAKGEPHLTDFGLARLLETKSTVTHTMDVLGTPSYMAPEQASGRNEQPSSATDIYGLGAVLYQLLTGHPPFAGGTSYETIRLLLDTEPRQPRLWNRKVDRELSTICLKCLEKDPKLRYSSALALAEDLEHWLKHEPIRAKRSGFFTYAGKWVRRNPSIAVLATLLVALAVGMDVMTWKRESPALVPKSVAVLPFENLSRDPDNAYFVTGIQNEIITRLAQIGALKVISRTSTQHYTSSPDNLPEIAKQLGVASILEGSVQKVGDQVHINVQLIRAATDAHLWAESYNRKLDDIFAVESDVAQIVAETLNAKLSSAEQQAIGVRTTDSPAAYDAYLRGLALQSKGNQPQAETAFREAVRLDPRFAMAWAWLAMTRSYFFQNGIIGPDHTPEGVKQAADVAFRLQPELGEAWLAQGYYHYHCLRDYAGALQEFKEAQKRLPNNSDVLSAIAYIERRQGQWDAEVAHLQQAVQIDPRNLTVLGSLAESLLSLRRFAESRAVLDRCLEISPGDLYSLTLKAATYQAEGRLDQAGKLLDPLSLSPSEEGIFSLIKVTQLLYERRFEEAVAASQAVLTRQSEPHVGAAKGYAVLLGYAQLWAGHAADARTAFDRAISAIKPAPDSVVSVDDTDLPCFLAMAYAGLGDKQAALAQAHKAIELYRDDAVNKPIAEITLAQIEAQFGNIDASIAALPRLLKVPNGITPGLLRIDPLWDPLRSDPRFQKLCEEKQP